MIIHTQSGYQAQAQIAQDYPQQLRDHDKRLQIASTFSDLMAVRNPRRLEFQSELEELFKKYQ